MNQHQQQRKQLRNGLVCEYEAMSQKGTVPFFEQTDFAEIALHYHENNNLTAALTVLDTALDFFKMSQELRYLKAATHLALQEGEKAQAELECAEVLAEPNFLPELFRAMALIKHQRDDEAFDILMKQNARWLDCTMPGIESDTKNSRLMNLLCSYGRMFDHYKTAILKNPTDEGILEQLWICVELSGRHEESVALHKFLIDIRPYSARAWYNLGYACLNLGQTGDALEAFEYAFLIDPTFELAYIEHGGLALKEEKIDLALYAYREMLLHCGASPDVMVYIGVCFEHQGKVDKALEWYSKAVDEDSKHADAFFKIARLYYVQNQFKMAQRNLKKAIALDSRQEAYYTLLGDVCKADNRMTEALQAYQTAVDIAPEDSQCWLALVQLLFEQGKYTDALEILKEGMDYCIDSELPFVRAACHFRLGNRPFGLRWLQTAHEGDGEGSDLFFEWVPDLREDREVKNLFQGKG